MEELEVNGLKKFRCIKCNKTFGRRYHLKRHLLETKCREHDELTTNACPICARVFSRKSNLVSHMKIHEVEAKGQKYPCKMCGKQFHSNYLLQSHERWHTEAKSFNCSKCSKSFPSTCAVSSHRCLQSAAVKSCKCEISDAKFPSQHSPEGHNTQHSDIKPYKNQSISNQVIQSGDRKDYISNNTEENGYQCEICGNVFNRKARLITHFQFSHEKANPFECDASKKKFSSATERHTSIHPRAKVMCTKCGKQFAERSTLKSPMTTHTKAAIASPECGRDVPLKDCLIRHVHKRHGEEIGGFLKGTLNRTEECVLNEAQLADRIKELLMLLLESPTLRNFGYPHTPVDQILEAVICRTGHVPAKFEKCPFVADRLRENIRLLFTMAIDDTSLKAMFNTKSVDEVILHILQLPKE